MGTIVGIINSIDNLYRERKLCTDKMGKLYFMDWQEAIDKVHDIGPIYVLKEEEYTPAMKVLYGKDV